MKFLSKKQDSVILQEALIYRKNAAKNNERLKGILLIEQCNFCAYTEKYIESLDSTEVEHLNAHKKYDDDYFNYYAVIRGANLYKQDEKYPSDSSFFQSLFFQNKQEWEDRIKYEDGIYIETDENDREARDFIEFIGLNHPKLYEQRRNHIKKLKRNQVDAKYSNEAFIAYLTEHKQELSFITAIEYELELDLSHLIH